MIKLYRLKEINIGLINTLIHQLEIVLTHFKSMFNFYTSWKRQEAKGFLTFSGGIKMEHWLKMC